MIDTTPPRVWSPPVCGLRSAVLRWRCGCEPAPRGVLGRVNIA